MLGGVDTVVLNDPASDEPTFGNKFRTLTAYSENPGCLFSRPRKPRSVPLGIWEGDLTELPEEEIVPRWPQ